MLHKGAFAFDVSSVRAEPSAQQTHLLPAHCRRDELCWHSGAQDLIPESVPMCLTPTQKQVTPCCREEGQHGDAGSQENALLLSQHPGRALNAFLE